MTSIADLESDVRRAREHLAHAERLLKEEQEGFVAEDARGHKLHVCLTRSGATFVGIEEPSDGGMVDGINLNDQQSHHLYRYLARKLGFNL